jgi:hypothetical protein
MTYPADTRQQPVPEQHVTSLRTGRAGRIFTVTLAAVAFAAAVALAFVAHDQGNQASQLRATVTTLSRQLQVARDGLVSLNNEYQGLSGQVSNLNQPSDPLSAYNDVCNQPITNDATGNVQTYYFPCTNNAQTIPQPGN